MKKHLLIIFILLSSILPAQSKIIFSEIMFKPQSGNNEFIELYNLSPSDSIDLSGYKIKYYTSKEDVIISAGEGTTLPPLSFAVIFEGDYEFSSGIYKEIIPDNALILKISDNAFGSSGISNSTDREIILFNSAGDTIAAHTYSANNSTGYSDEKIILNNDDSDSNWSNSISFNGTPGYINSVTPKLYDLQITNFKHINSYGLPGEPQDFQITVINQGINIINNYSIEIYIDENFDSLVSVNEKALVLTGSKLNANDTANFNFEISNLSIGKNILIAKLVTGLDEDSTNNTAYTRFDIVKINEIRNDIVINEIMYAPLSPEPEWIELYNNSTKEINLLNYQLADNADTNKIVFDSFIFHPDEYLIISADSSLLDSYNISSKFVTAKLPTLNNSSDKIILLDSLNRVIDSLEYSDDWGGTKGYSLERISTDESSINQANWLSSVNKLRSTPGKINSVSKKVFDIYLSDIIFYPAAPQLKDKVEISVLLKNIGKSDGSFSVSLFEDTNQDSTADLLLDNIVNITIAPDDSLIVSFNYQIPGLTKERSFIAEINFPADQDTSNNFILKTIKPGYVAGSVVINEIMYDPEIDQPEWIELYNNSTDTLNLKDWQLVNLLPEPSSKILTGNNLYLEPGNFLVVTPDSSFLTSNNIPSSHILINNFGTLSNSMDGLAIYDFRNTKIDSLIYNSSWGGNNGFSLERISASANSNDSTNWRSSLSKNKNTAGIINSVINLISYKHASVVINEIMFDPGADNSEFIELQNITADSINIGGWEIIDGNDNHSTVSNIEFYLPPGQYYIIANDSSTAGLYFIKNYFNVTDDKLSLSNSGEQLILKDVNGDVIDSLIYSADWHNSNFVNTKNRSLERINPYINSSSASNWSSSVSSSGATPGKQNSIYTKSTEPASKISISPNPFSPDNDGFEDFTIISYSLTQPVAQVRIEIFDSKGRHVRTLRDNYASGSKGAIIFDGLDDEHRPLRIGIYILLFEAINENNGVLEQYKKAFVIARKL